MYNRDYMLRMIEMLGDFVAAILRLVRDGNLDGASKLIDRVYHEVLKKDASFFNSIPADAITTTLLHEHNFTGSHLSILSELFYAQGELLESRGNAPGAIINYEKALILRDYVMNNSTSFSVDDQSKIEMLQEKLRLIKLTGNG